MRVINWNVSYAGSIENKIKFLQTYLTTKNCCVILQEVKPHAYEYIKQLFIDDYKMFYSLDYRKPSKFDSDARKLGVLILVSNDIDIESAGIIERCPFPDRTVYATLRKLDKTVKVLALHSLTGCGYYKTKSVQYDSFAEFINEYRPDIIGIDANEPRIDHYDILKMSFFDNGLGAKNFFNEIIEIGLTDTYVRFYDTKDYVSGQPLTTSHYIRKKGAVRYDFLFTRKTYDVNYCLYNFDEAVASGSDHAIIVSELLF